ncbi:transcriptional regulator, TetR family [Catenulispora acidiphila DSM 44928]|uniref:Transcriptional regulator, TetR family n=1 Tax=Catenulispora acidiphila (strain DSM 44928 / JCM 14897 / NBRC 102108 / NRRL B-24433 / ID139908) TaxID=479433 RepID=C7PYN5_CATAD|nr:TetR/AcrR family transcriptional regulator [Catenulispora acidiphila]ACU77357.1 transcriptional regulator, TetR family [Catenulispora acidiphila DSM 44928]
MTDQAHHPRQRRHGEELEAALLEAAWQELVETGFTKLTMESIATRAKTGVAVLYRRWPNKDDMILAAIRHYGTTHPVAVPDTGNLRDDMVAFLTGVSVSRVSFAAIISATFAGLRDSTGMTPAELRERVMSNASRWSEQLLARAQDRGEIDLDAIPPAVLSMPFDLIRHEMLMTYKPIAPERVIEIVDDLFMPLVTINRRKNECAS